MSSSKLSRERAHQPATNHGVGKIFVSPTKPRASKRKAQTLTKTHFGANVKRLRIEGELAALLQNKGTPEQPNTPLNTGGDCLEGTAEGTGPYDGDAWVDEPMDTGSDETGTHPVVDVESTSTASTRSTRPRRLVPDQHDLNLTARWRELIGGLVDDVLLYYQDTRGRATGPADRLIQEQCATGKCVELRAWKSLALYYDHFREIKIEHCSCRSAAQVMVRNGLFPTSPSQPRVCVSIEFLDLYAALFERSCDAILATSLALNTFYTRRGFHLLGKKDARFREPFRRGLGHAAQWMDVLRIAVEQRVERALELADQEIQGSRKAAIEGSTGIALPNPNGPQPSIPPTSNGHQTNSSSITKEPPPSKESGEEEHTSPSRKSSPPTPPLLPSSQEECARFLRQLCPACFGSAKFGSSLTDGGDFQICTDGNFHHRHLANGGQGVPYLDPKHIIQKSFVDSVGDHIATVRKSPQKPRKGQVPDEAVDECEHSYEAANGDKKKGSSSGPRYDSQGWMSLICRHDIPLLFANIDTPGEQQKYVIALILWFFALVPPTATATVLYDIGCVLDRSLELYDILPEDIVSRLQLATTAMHAYGHQWACQLVYNPRLKNGLGLTDGEGVERIWSRLRRLIAIVRTSSLARRISITDSLLSSIAFEMRDRLGDWVANRLRRGVQAQGNAAQQTMKDCGIPIEELRKEWAHQKEAQSSIRAHAPARLKKDIDAVLSLQTEVEEVEKAIIAAKSGLSAASKKTKKVVRTLLKVHEELTEAVEELYASLEIQEAFPSLEGVDLEFVRNLLMARDLKINIRKRAIGSFFEWDRLDQAVGGRNQALGTKLHQQTHKAITKRTPALMTAVKKFNKYCARLEALYDTGFNIPLPTPLPTKLADLRNDSTLMEDIWITTLETEIPRWLEDRDVRRGIQAMLKADRCLEERRRLGCEADNLCRWFGRELLAVEVAIRKPENCSVRFLLSQHRKYILQLKSRWSNPLASPIRFDAHVQEAQQFANSLDGNGKNTWNNTYADSYVDSDLEGPLAQAFIETGEVEGQPQDATEGEDDGEVDCGLDPMDVVLADTISAEVDGEESTVQEDTSTLTYSEGTLIIGAVDQAQKIDHQLLRSFQNSSVPPSTGPPFAKRYSGNTYFEKNDLERLESSSAMLNDVCVNGIGNLLQAINSFDSRYCQSSTQCAVFATYDLSRVRYKASDRELWRATAKLEFWKRETWVVPIHRPREQHWVLAVVHPLTGHIFAYDSLAGKRMWVKDLENVTILVRRLALLAARNGHAPIYLPTQWTAQLAVMQPLQSNGHDCGLWVLAWMAAILRGYHLLGSDFTESKMVWWRKFLLTLVRGLPTHSSKS